MRQRDLQNWRLALGKKVHEFYVEFIYCVAAVSTSSFGTSYYRHNKPTLWLCMLSSCVETVDAVLARHVFCIGHSCIHSCTVQFPYLETCWVRKW